jgi:hypothetical protein
MENTRKSEAIEQVLRDMENLTREELLEEIEKNLPAVGCEVNIFSSRVCSRGTISCILTHSEDTPDNCNSV